MGLWKDAPMTATDNRALVERFWQALYDRDWDGIASFFGPTSEYTDVPTPADDLAVGPDQILARLRLGLEPITAYEHDLILMVADGDVVVTEHTETWHWKTGEVVTLPFVSVHVVRDGTIERWSDYWDLQTLLGAAPEWWIEHIMVGWQDPSRLTRRLGPAPLIRKNVNPMLTATAADADDHHHHDRRLGAACRPRPGAGAAHLVEQVAGEGHVLGEQTQAECDDEQSRPGAAEQHHAEDQHDHAAAMRMIRTTMWRLASSTVSSRLPVSNRSRSDPRRPAPPEPTRAAA